MSKQTRCVVCGKHADQWQGSPTGEHLPYCLAHTMMGAWPMQDTITFSVPGEPVPQGSMVRTNYGMRHAKPLQITYYRSAVTAAWNEKNINEPLTGPLQLEVVFVLPRPKSAPKRRTQPEVKPDLDKLIRALADALTLAGAWIDDAQVTRIAASKIYPNAEHPLPATIVKISPCPG